MCNHQHWFGVRAFYVSSSIVVEGALVKTKPPTRWRADSFQLETTTSGSLMPFLKICNSHSKIRFIVFGCFHLLYGWIYVDVTNPWPSTFIGSGFLLLVSSKDMPILPLGPRISGIPCMLKAKTKYRFNLTIMTPKHRPRGHSCIWVCISFIEQNVLNSSVGQRFILLRWFDIGISFKDSKLV